MLLFVWLGRDDLRDFEELMTCLNALGFTQSDVVEVFGLLAGILHLGNVVLECSEVDSDELTLDDQSQESFNNCCRLFGIENKEMLRLLKFKTITDAASQEKIVLPRTSDATIYARDSLCKAVYERLFQWIVNRVNVVLATEFNAGKKIADGTFFTLLSTQRAV